MTKLVETAINESGDSIVFNEKYVDGWSMEGHIISDLFFSNSMPQMEQTGEEVTDRNFNLAPGQIRFFKSQIEPTKKVYNRLKKQDPSVKMEGLFYHSTTTIDYIVVVSGELTMIVGDKKISLVAGDAVIQRGAAHAWHNYTDQAAVIMGVMIGAKPSKNFKQVDTVQPE